MKIFKKILNINISLSLFFILKIASVSYSQDYISLLKQSDCFVNKNEKVFVKLEKPVFSSGETLKYTAFIVNASTLKKDMQSKILYFEITSNNDTRVLFWRVNVSSGLVTGSTTLPDSLSSGIYTLRAYTNWMRNNSIPLYFSEKILITRLADHEFASANTAVLNDSIIDGINFYPEGNQLIEGIETKIGVRVNFLDSTSNSILGKIKDNNDSSILAFQTDKFGLGLFSFKPQAGKLYRAEITNRNGNINSYKLPKPKKYGYSLSMDFFETVLKIKAFSNSDEIPGKTNLKLFVRSHGKLVCDTTIKLIDGAGVVNINPDRLPCGINQIILLDIDNNIVCQRLVYIPSINGLRVKESTEKFIFSKGEKVRLSLEVENVSNSDTLQLVVTAFQKPLVQNIGRNQDIRSYLNFYSEIANPPVADTFNLQMAEKILLTTLPQQYLWNVNKSIKKEDCPFFIENKGFILSGKIKNRVSGIPLRNATVTCAYTDSIVSLKYCLTDSNGMFYFLLDQSYDNKDLVLQISNNNLADNDIVWDIDKKNGHSETFKKKMVYFSNEELEFLESFRKISLVNAIFQDRSSKIHAANSRKNLQQRMDFFVKPDYSRLPSDYTELENFQDIVDNILPGVWFKSRDNNYSVNVLNSELRTMFPQQATIMLNGVLFDDLEYISTLGTKEIKQIDVVMSQILYGDLTFYGLISIRTKDGKILANYYNSERVLYKNEVQLNQNDMNESHINVTEKNLPDLRQTLFMDKSVQLVGNKKSVIEFKTSNLKSSYIIDVQGYTNQGFPVSSSIEIEVK